MLFLFLWRIDIGLKINIINKQNYQNKGFYGEYSAFYGELKLLQNILSVVYYF